MDDLSTYALLVSSATFVFLSFALLFRYRQISKQITASNDLGKDLWAALEGRLTKQDERILDVMGRVEVIQSRVLEKQTTEESAKIGPAFSDAVSVKKGETVHDLAVQESQGVTSMDVSHTESPHVTTNSEFVHAVDARFNRQDERLVEMLNRLESIQSRLTSRESNLDASTPRSSSPTSRVRDVSDKVSEVVLIQMLGEKARTSVEIRERFGITREHAARVLKGFFDRKLVTRNDTHKPFVYELTGAGRSMLAEMSPPLARLDTPEETSHVTSAG